ncbi:hypothetical protein ACFOM8_21500, partial [Paracoccus angustae]
MAGTFLDNETWRYFWHPVCTARELAESDTGRGQLLRVKLVLRFFLAPVRYGSRSPAPYTCRR